MRRDMMKYTFQGKRKISDIDWKLLIEEQLQE
jgi:hypothetical protein